jgi:hypothetical protein
LLTFYFVTTALLTVRRRSQEVSWIDGAAVVLALTVSGLACKAGLDLVSRGRPEAIPCFIFAVVGLLAAAGDIRMMREGGVQGPRRIARICGACVLRCGLPPPHFSGARPTASLR